MRYYFDWDPQKAKANLKKHKVSFEQGASIFLDQREVAKIPVDLSVGNVNFEAKTFTIYRSKNTKTRVLSLPSETWDDLKEYRLGERSLKIKLG